MQRTFSGTYDLLEFFLYCSYYILMKIYNNIVMQMCKKNIWKKFYTTTDYKNMYALANFSHL